MSETRLTVDWTRCRAHGLCVDLAPELLDRDPWGYPLLRTKDVPRGQEPLARAAAKVCPALALKVESRASAV